MIKVAFLNIKSKKKIEFCFCYKLSSSYWNNLPSDNNYKLQKKDIKTQPPGGTEWVPCFCSSQLEGKPQSALKLLLKAHRISTLKKPEDKV